jgi:hypothetical protein
VSRDNAHLVNVEGDINEAGKRFLDLKQEWLSQIHGHVDEQSHFNSKGFYGTYNVEVVTPSKKISNVELIMCMIKVTLRWWNLLICKLIYCYERINVSLSFNHSI